MQLPVKYWAQYACLELVTCFGPVFEILRLFGRRQGGEERAKVCGRFCHCGRGLGRDGCGVAGKFLIFYFFS